VVPEKIGTKRKIRVRGGRGLEQKRSKARMRNDSIREKKKKGRKPFEGG